MSLYTERRSQLELPWLDRPLQGQIKKKMKLRFSVTQIFIVTLKIKLGLVSYSDCQTWPHVSFFCLPFQAGWTSVRDYHTYAWALAPEDYTAGKDVNGSILFHRTSGGTLFLLTLTVNKWIQLQDYYRFKYSPNWKSIKGFKCMFIKTYTSSWIIKAKEWKRDQFTVNRFFSNFRSSQCGQLGFLLHKKL